MKRPMHWLVMLSVFAWGLANRAIPDDGWSTHLFFTLSAVVVIWAIDHAYLPPRKRSA